MHEAIDKRERKSRPHTLHSSAGAQIVCVLMEKAVSLWLLGALIILIAMCLLWFRRQKVPTLTQVEAGSFYILSEHQHQLYKM